MKITVDLSFDELLRVVKSLPEEQRLQLKRELEDKPKNYVDIVSSDPDILAGQPVFIGTRLPIESRFDHLAAGVSLDDFLEDFPSVTKELAIALIDINRNVQC